MEGSRRSQRATYYRVRLLVLRSRRREGRHRCAEGGWQGGRCTQDSPTAPFPIGETFDVGIDTRTPVDDDYQLPFRFNGKIDKLINLKARTNPADRVGSEENA